MRAIIGDFWLLASGLIIYAGFVTNSTVILALGVLVLGAGGASRLWARISLEEVTYTRTLSESRAFVGETIDVEIELANHKFAPVPWVEVRELIPQETLVVDGEARASGLPRTAALYRNTSLRSHQTLRWPIKLLATKRGYFRLGPTRLRSGDLFGFFPSERDFPQQDSITVYPKTYPLDDLGLTSARPFGEHGGGQRIFEDPMRVIGVRDYSPGDPLKRVDWRATARLGRLQSRIYQPSHEQSVIVALNITTLEQTWEGFDPVLLERTVSVAASIAQGLFERGSAVGLVANGSYPDADRPLRLAANRRTDQLAEILAMLAMVQPLIPSRLAAELESREHPLPAGATIVVVAALMPDDLVGTLQRLRAEGYALHVVKTSEEPWEARLDQIPITDLSAAMRTLEEADETPEPAVLPGSLLRGTMSRAGRR